jgi:putative acyl-CoA dehydrogenase
MFELGSNKSKFRVLIPLFKLYAAKKGIKVISEGVESFGGVGYMENSFIP